MKGYGKGKFPIFAHGHTQTREPLFGDPTSCVSGSGGLHRVIIRPEQDELRSITFLQYGVPNFLDHCWAENAYALQQLTHKVPEQGLRSPFLLGEGSRVTTYLAPRVKLAEWNLFRSSQTFEAEHFKSGLSDSTFREY